MKRLVLIAGLLLPLGCGKLGELPTDPLGNGGQPPDPTATFTRVQQEVFTPTCSQIACHDTLGRQQGLILVANQAYANVVNAPSTENPSLVRVAPGNPAGSYLYRKVVGSGITGDRMPQLQTPLSEAKLALIRDWIRRGAPND